VQSAAVGNKRKEGEQVGIMKTRGKIDKINFH
jgi:hypothetical protein